MEYVESKGILLCKAGKIGMCVRDERWSVREDQRGSGGKRPHPGNSQTGVQRLRFAPARLPLPRGLEL